jgi:hypothetical protein
MIGFVPPCVLFAFIVRFGVAVLPVHIMQRAGDGLHCTVIKQSYWPAYLLTKSHGIRFLEFLDRFC